MKHLIHVRKHFLEIFTPQVIRCELQSLVLCFFFWGGGVSLQPLRQWTDSPEENISALWQKVNMTERVVCDLQPSRPQTVNTDQRAHRGSVMRAEPSRASKSDTSRVLMFHCSVSQPCKNTELHKIHQCHVDLVSDEKTHRFWSCLRLSNLVSIFLLVQKTMLNLCLTSVSYLKDEMCWMWWE